MMTAGDEKDDSQEGTVEETSITSNTDDLTTTAAATTTESSHKIPILFQDEITMGKLLGGGGFCQVYNVQSVKINPDHHKFTSTPPPATSNVTSDEHPQPCTGNHQPLLRDQLQLRFKDMEEYKFLYETTDQTLPLPDPLRPPRLAVKRLRKQIDLYFGGMDQGGVQSAIQDLNKEFHVLKHLQLECGGHRNLIQIYAHGYDEVKPIRRFSPQMTFLIVDHLRYTLREKLTKWRNMRGAGVLESVGLSPRSLQTSWLERIIVLSQVASAVAFLHASGIIHRDLSPNNIGYDSDGTVKVFDFGLARFLRDVRNVKDKPNNKDTEDDSDDETIQKEVASTTETTETATASDNDNKDEYEVFELTGNTGTMRYMAPEVYMGNQCGLGSDVYSLSMICYEVLSLWMPFVHIKGEEMFITQVFQGKERPDVESAYWPPAVRQLLTEMWHADPTQRPTSQQVTERLEQLLRGSDEDLFPSVGVSRWFGRNS